MNKVKYKAEQEIQVVQQMIALYCHKKHSIKSGLCPDCEHLQDYAIKKIRNCPFIETRTFCSSCKVHCYHPKMQKKIREVMKFSGPRMLYYHPAMALRHTIEQIRNSKVRK